MIIPGSLNENLNRMKNFNLKTTTLLLLSFLIANGVFAQCATWNDLPNKDELEGIHSVYRGHMKSKQFSEAHDHWLKVYEAAPAADGQRDFHYTDGIKIMMDKFNNSEGADKEAAKEMILKLYDEAIACFEGGGIKMKQSADERIAYHMTRKAFDMFYYLQTPYSQTMSTVEGAIEKSGKNAEYTLLDPYARMAVNMFTNDNMDKAKAREIHAKVNEIADYNIENNESYGSYYKQAKESANGVFAEIEDNIFDCDYFKPAIMATYKANSNDPTTIENTIRELKRRACAEDDPFLKEVEANWAKYASAENARRKSEYEANNPSVMARKLRDAGDYAGAIAKYQSAIGTETDPSKQALYYYQMGQIHNKQKQFNSGMAAARKAAELRPDWGNPHMLMGDLMVGNSSKCGSALLQKGCYMAAINKYRKAKSVDSSVSGKADEKISRYSSSKYRLSSDDKENAFMQGYKEGSTLKLPCIGTSVTLRF